MTALFNETPLKPLLEAAFADSIAPARGAQVATLFPSDPGDDVNESGYRDCDTPFHGWVGHLDGLWNGGTRPPSIGVELTAEARAAWYGENGTNTVARTNPGGINIWNFTALVGVALSDQTQEGAGNLGVLRGAHHHIEAFFRSQRAAGGPLGPDGPDWPREHLEAPNRHGLRHYPEAVREAFVDGAARTADGRIWPRPTFMRLAPGDAVVVLHATPHGGSRVAAADPRQMVYFRVQPAGRPETMRRWYADALCDNWLEWRGLPTMRARHHRSG